MQPIASTQPEIATERHPSPPLLLLALVHVVLFVAGLLSVTAFSSDVFPSPFAPIARATEFFSLNQDEARASAFFHFASAFPLGLFAAVMSSRLRFLGVRAAGESIALYGGLGASLMILVSSMCTWANSEVAPLAESGVVVRGLQWLGFAAGGPAMVALLGLLVAGAAVTSGLHDLMPRWAMWLGIAIAAIAELSTLTLIWPAAAYLVPAGRILGSAWLVVAAVTLPKSRAELRAAAHPTSDYPAGVFGAGLPRPLR